MLKSCSGQEHLDYSITVHRLTGKEAKALKLMGFLTGSETCSPREGRPLGEKRPQNRCFEQILFASSTSSSYSRATASSVPAHLSRRYALCSPPFHSFMARLRETELVTYMRTVACPKGKFNIKASQTSVCQYIPPPSPEKLRFIFASANWPLQIAIRVIPYGKKISIDDPIDVNKPWWSKKVEWFIRVTIMMILVFFVDSLTKTKKTWTLHPIRPFCPDTFASTSPSWRLLGTQLHGGDGGARPVLKVGCFFFEVRNLLDDGGCWTSSFFNPRRICQIVKWSFLCPSYRPRTWKVDHVESTDDEDYTVLMPAELDRLDLIAWGEFRVFPMIIHPYWMWLIMSVNNSNNQRWAIGCNVLQRVQA